MNEKLDKDLVQKLFLESKNSIKVSNKTEPLLDKRLILEIFARNVALHISNLHPLETNGFKKFEAVIDNEKVYISVGFIKKSENSEPTITYGIL